MKVDTYLNYGGNCAEAFRFYEKHLSGTILFMMTHEQSPEPLNVPPEWKKAVLHATLQLGGATIMGADVPSYEPMRSAYLSLSLDSTEEAERVYKLLTEGGQIFMPIQETFFAHRFAMFRDRFGTAWMLLHSRPMPSTS